MSIVLLETCRGTQ